MNSFRRFSTAPTMGTLAALAVIGLGLALRIRQLSLNLSFWLDEAMLALNLVNRSFAGLAKPLDYDQGAPLGFLWLSKIAGLALGYNEYALRLLPFAAGCASLFLLWLLARQLLKPAGGVLVLLLFATSRYLVSYSAQFKQYAVDGAITLLLYLLVMRQQGKPLTIKSALGIALAGGLAIWISHPAVFTLAGIGLVLLGTSLRARDRRSIAINISIGIFWALNFGILYFLQYRGLAANNFLTGFWADFFMPLGVDTPGWIISQISGMFIIPGGLTENTPALLLPVLFAMGVYQLGRGGKPWLWMFLIGLVFTLAASAVDKYPFGGRMVMFAMPGMLICAAAGLELLTTMPGRLGMAGWAAAGVLALYLTASPVLFAIQSAQQPKMTENIAGTLAFIKANYHNGDVIYLHPMSVPAFRFYAPKYGLSQAPVVDGSDFHEDRQAYQQELSSSLSGYRRVWLLFSHMTDQQYVDDRDAILRYVEKMGIRKHEYSEPRTLVYLYLYQLGR